MEHMFQTSQAALQQQKEGQRVLASVPWRDGVANPVQGQF
jgi:hypothetical protein